MDFMNKITQLSKKVGDVATDTYNTVANKSGKLFEDAKLKLNIADKETEINDIYITMGKTVYDAYKSGEDVGKVFNKEAKKIDKVLNEIEEMNKKILYNKGLRICANCGENISKESIYCLSCGNKQKPIKIKEEKRDDNTKEETEELNKICPQCGIASIPQSKFCTKCGYKF